MNRQDLRDRLRALHGELKQLDSVGESDRQPLEELRADIQDLLGRDAGPDMPAYRRLHQRLRASVERFEASHPTLTALMAETADLLSNMGI